MTELEIVTHQRDLLMQAIAEAAFKAGITNGEAPLDGPMCLLVLEDMATEIKELRQPR